MGFTPREDAVEKELLQGVCGMALNPMQRSGDSRTASHAIVTDDGVNVPHRVVTGVLGPGNGDSARVALLINLNVGSGAPLQLLNCITLLPNDTSDHRSGARHRLARSETILQCRRQLVNGNPIHSGHKLAARLTF